MPTIIYSPSEALSQVDDFPADCERTVKGALYVRPGGTAVVSEGEATHLKTKGVKYSVAGKRATPLATAPTQPAPSAATGAKPAGASPAPVVAPLIGSGPFGGAQGDQK